MSSNLITPTLTVTATPTSICAGGSILLAVTGNGDEYLWQGGSVTSTILLTPLPATQYSVTSTFTSNGCSSTVQFTPLVFPCLGMSESPQNILAVYPNPASEKLIVVLSKQGFMEIRSPEGKLIRKGDMNRDENIIDLRELSPGIYFLHYLSGNEISRVRFIKM